MNENILPDFIPTKSLKPDVYVTLAVSDRIHPLFSVQTHRKLVAHTSGSTSLDHNHYSFQVQYDSSSVLKAL